VELRGCEEPWKRHVNCSCRARVRRVPERRAWCRSRPPILLPTAALVSIFRRDILTNLDIILPNEESGCGRRRININHTRQQPSTYSRSLNQNTCMHVKFQYCSAHPCGRGDRVGETDYGLQCDRASAKVSIARRQELPGGYRSGWSMPIVRHLYLAHFIFTACRRSSRSPGLQCGLELLRNRLLA
jgi:hypothetical protein